MQWLHPTYLWALLTLPLVGALFWWADRQRRAAAERFGDSVLLRDLAPEVLRGRRLLRYGVLGTAIALLALALAGPRIGTELRRVERRGIDLVIALDVSSSMQAQDVGPDRLRRAKLEIEQLLAELQGDRVGLVLFAGEAFLQCPLTVDHSAFRMFLDVAEPASIPTPGTNFGAAIRTAIDAFDRGDDGEKASAAENRSRAILLISDGEQHQDVPEELRAELRSSNVTVFGLGVGRREGAPIPVYENGQRVGYKRNQRGRVVQTRLRANALRELATEERYFELSGPGSIREDVAGAIDRLDRTSLGTREFESYTERYAWPLALALLLLASEPLIRVYRRRERIPA